MDVVISGSTLEVDPGDGSLDIFNLGTTTTISIIERDPPMPKAAYPGSGATGFPVGFPTGLADYTSIKKWVVQVNSEDWRRPLVIPMGGSTVTGIGATTNSQAGALAAQAAIAAAIP